LVPNLTTLPMRTLFPLLAVLLAATSLTRGADTRPNIVFIFSDDHALESISAYGGRLKEIAPTANIDRLARDGALFRNSFCSNSICGPSRAAILTGKHSHINGYLDNQTSEFDSSQTTFPKLMQKAGYQTAIIGKWHLVSNPTGFDHWEVLPGQGNYYNPDFLQMDGSKKRCDGYVTDLVTDHAIDWLQHRRDPNKPFVLMAQHKAPHRNWTPPVRLLGMFEGKTIPEPNTLFDNYANRATALAGQEMSIAKDFTWSHDMLFRGDNQFTKHFASGMGNAEYNRMSPADRSAWDNHYEPENNAFLEQLRAGTLSDADVTRWKYQRYMKNYLACVRALDENVGRMLDYLDSSGLARNTIVIYGSDQGFYLGEHGWYDKRWMFEESLKMPFIIRWPGVVKPASEPAAMVQNIDYAPTFLEIAGAPIPKEIQGRSLVPILKSGETPKDWRDSIYYFYSGEPMHRVARHDGVRTDRYKLIRFPDTDEWNLFDLQKDPGEMRSVHAAPEYAEVAAQLHDRYAQLRRDFRVSDSTVPAERLAEGWWKARHAQKSAAAKQGAEIIFIGDSITQGWEDEGKPVWDKFFAPRNALNLGFSGDRTEHVLWRLLNDGLPPTLDPKLAVLMVGTNNTGQSLRPAAETADGIRQIVELLRDRRPNMKILLLAIFPRGASADDPQRLRNREINDLVKPLADGSSVTFLDLAPTFLASDGSLPPASMPDMLHLSPDGYRLWAEAIEPIIQRHVPLPAK
jgi:arylsulfatase A-like enzyme/lysophospholipase L1-like esterase